VDFSEPPSLSPVWSASARRVNVDATFNVPVTHPGVVVAGCPTRPPTLLKVRCQCPTSATTIVYAQASPASWRRPLRQSSDWTMLDVQGGRRSARLKREWLLAGLGAFPIAHRNLDATELQRQQRNWRCKKQKTRGIHCRAQRAILLMVGVGDRAMILHPACAGRLDDRCLRALRGNRMDVTKRKNDLSRQRKYGQQNQGRMPPEAVQGAPPIPPCTTVAARFVNSWTRRSRPAGRRRATKSHRIRQANGEPGAPHRWAASPVRFANAGCQGVSRARRFHERRGGNDAAIFCTNRYTSAFVDLTAKARFTAKKASTDAFSPSCMATTSRPLALTGFEVRPTTDNT